MKEYIIRTDAELRVENGRFTLVYDGSCVHTDMVKELPLHGRLIDADRLTQVMKDAILISNNGDLKDDLMKLVGECTIDYLKELPTILEASKE